ncbi:alpha/beta fold hydrolase [Solimicrobium silvestre]|uniref:Alpha/beta hydrolase family n=1 Tax=Solimicrobium silvestre TaxID=2099400 RepID=A0A2S9GSL6_9BURK|nr:alpha/beta hydrolase [Solimicrobium silvestre]PRC90695.1 Alpha/beta hydrolase family [Solimicrobium silvestre]
MKTSTSEFIALRGHQYHCRHWGDPTAPMIFMVHGWMDVGASFQFVVDSLKADWHVIAPDMRGFGLTNGPTTDAYWFPDYLADLDALLQHYSPDAAINLVGHSMGGNVVGLYAGIRPERIAKLVILEGFGLPTTKPTQAPARYKKWLDELREKPEMRTYASAAEVAKRLQKTNPRLNDERAAFLAQHWSRENASGQWEILGDPAHKLSSPILYRVEEVMACWEAVTAPVLWVEADDTAIWSWIGGKEKGRPETDRRLTHFKQLKTELVLDAGHMLHHDQPQALAKLIEDFVGLPKAV